MISFNCPACSLAIQVSESLSGQQVACAQCGEKIRVPGEVSREVPRPKLVSTPPPRPPELAVADQVILLRMEIAEIARSLPAMLFGTLAVAQGVLGIVSFWFSSSSSGALYSGAVGLVMAVVGCIVAWTNGRAGLRYSLVGLVVSLLSILLQLGLTMALSWLGIRFY